MAFSREPLVLGKEAFVPGLGGLHQLAALLTDPVLRVEFSEPETPDEFRPVTEDERGALFTALDAVVQHDDPVSAEAAAQLVLASFGVDVPDDASASSSVIAGDAQRIDAGQVAADLVSAPAGKPDGEPATTPAAASEPDKGEDAAGDTPAEQVAAKPSDAGAASVGASQPAPKAKAPKGRSSKAAKSDD